MRKLWWLAVAVTSLSGICSAGTMCGDGTLSSYVALGATGCTIGSNTLFDFAIVSGISGAMAIDASAVSLTPMGGSLNPGLTTSLSATAASGNILEAIFTYKISGDTYVGSSIDLANSSESGDGAVTGLQNFCAGGFFGMDGLSGCTGTAGSLGTLDGIQNSDSSGFGGVNFLSVTDDFTLDGGLGGSASGGTLTDQFATASSSATPEPVSFVLTAVGLFLAGGLGVRRARRQFVPKSFVPRSEETSTSCNE